MTNMPVGYDLADPEDREDRRKHLDLISATISRMSTASSTTKGWAITLATAAFGAGALKSAWFLDLIGIIVIAAFLYLDVRYLDTEKRFRDLYDAVLVNTVPPLSMDTKNLTSPTRNASYKSWSILGLYVPMVIVGILLMFVNAVDAPDPDPAHPHHRHGVGEHGPSGLRR